MIRSSKSIKRGLLKKAFRENRGAEMISKILELNKQRMALVGDDKRLMAQFEIYNGLQPRTLRAYNYNQLLDGNDSTHYLFDTAAFIKHITRN